MPFIERETGGYLPLNPTQTQVEPDFWTSVDLAVYQAIPDWPIFQTETIAGLAIALIWMYVVHVASKTPPKWKRERLIAQERQKLR